MNFIKNSHQINSTRFNFNEHMLSILDANFRKDKNFILEVLKSDAIKKSPNRRLSDLLKFIDKELLKDSELILQALQIENDQQGDESLYDISWFKALDLGYNKNREFIRKFIEIMPINALMFACEDLKKDPELALAAIKKDEKIAEYINTELFKDRAFLVEVLRQYPSFTLPWRAQNDPAAVQAFKEAKFLNISVN